MAIVKNRVAIYARVSTSHHKQDPHIQINELKKYCLARGWVVAHEIIDHGYSGANDNRPGLSQLMELAETRKIDTIIVLKLDRLFRSLKHLVNVLDNLRALGLNFIAVNDHVDWSTPAGRFFIQVLGSLAELEKEILRERTLLGLDNARAKGIKLGRPRINLEGEIRTMRASGLTYRAIQKSLSVSQGTIARALRKN